MTHPLVIERGRRAAAIYADYRAALSSAGKVLSRDKRKAVLARDAAIIAADYERTVAGDPHAAQRDWRQAIRLAHDTYRAALFALKAEYATRVENATQVAIAACEQAGVSPRIGYIKMLGIVAMRRRKYG